MESYGVLDSSQFFSMTGPPRTLTIVQFFELLPYPPQSCRSWLDWNAFGKSNSVQFQPLFPRNSCFWSNRSSVQSFLGCFSFAVCLLAQSKPASLLFTLLHAKRDKKSLLLLLGGGHQAGIFSQNSKAWNCLKQTSCS